MPGGSKRNATPESPVHEIVPGRLLTVSARELLPEHMNGVTVVVNLTGDEELVFEASQYLCVNWSTSDNVDEGQFEGVVRLCASSMKTKDQRVLLIGHQDTVDTIGACILREFVGCDATTALAIMRQGRTSCLTKSELVETIFRFRPS